MLMRFSTGMFDALCSSMLRASIAVFLLFFSFAVLVFFAGTALSTPDDPYYHLSHAIAYERDTAMRLPTYSTLASRPDTDLYLWYHRALAPFTTFFGTDASAAIAGSKVFHALGTALFFTVFFWVLFSLLAGSGLSERARCRTALLGTIALAALSPLFVYRILLMRPHVFTASLMLAAVYALFQGRALLLVPLAIILPLFYSATFLFVIPVGVFTIVSAWFSRSPLTKPSLYAPLALTLGGLALGTLLHPYPYLHFREGSLVHIATLFNRFRPAGILEGGELYAAALFPAEMFWLIPFLCLVVWLLFSRSALARPPHSRLSAGEISLAALSLVFVALMLVVQRAAEYAVPVAFLALVVIAARRLPRAARAEWARLSNAARAAPFAAAIVALGEEFLVRRRVLCGAVVALGALFLAATFTKAALASYRASGEELSYRAAALYMAEHSKRDALVYYPEFSYYPRLVFWSAHNRFVSGMGGTFAYLYDPSLYWLMHHVGRGESVCPRARCSEGDRDLRDPFEALREDIGATFVFIDTSTPAFEKRFLDLLRRDERFELVFEDPEFKEIKVFRVGRK
jgi:hypothetical protein